MRAAGVREHWLQRVGVAHAAYVVERVVRRGRIGETLVAQQRTFARQSPHAQPARVGQHGADVAGRMQREVDQRPAFERVDAPDGAAVGRRDHQRALRAVLEDADQALVQRHDAGGAAGQLDHGTVGGLAFELQRWRLVLAAAATASGQRQRGATPRCPLGVSRAATLGSAP